MGINIYDDWNQSTMIIKILVLTSLLIELMVNTTLASQIEFTDYLEDQLGKGSLITITSGYRAPEYNTKLRKGGGLAAKASLHQYGMAADFIMDEVPSKRVWEYVRSIGFGGTGYYHGETVHVDVGPSRFWDEKTSGIGTGLSEAFSF